MQNRRLFFALAVFLAAAFFSVSGKWPWPRLDEESATQTVVAAPVRPTHVESADTLHSGETLSELLARNRVLNLDLALFAGALDPRRLRPGLVFNFRQPVEDSVPDRLVVRTSAEQRLMIHRVDSSWNAAVEEIAWRSDTVRVSGSIENSLYSALDRQVPDSLLDGGEREKLAWELADNYRWQVDFTRDTRAGDSFNVALERQVSEEGEVRFGRILASELHTNGRDLSAYRFEKSYYDKDGNSLQRAFLRAPVSFRRISSNFTRARFHPVLGRTRKHEGTDYAAATGTRVVAAGDGVVIRAGRAGGYGNLVEIRHRNGITTRYGHLSAIRTRVGARVKQEQLIGLVGMTGLATGPHLHYEFRVNGVAKDSRRVDLGNGAPVEKAKRAAFDAEQGRLDSLLHSDESPPAQPAGLIASAS